MHNTRYCFSLTLVLWLSIMTLKAEEPVNLSMIPHSRIASTETALKTQPSFLAFADLPEEGKKLLLAASEVKERAYNPYSHFYVGAALLTPEGQILTGANYECASYGGTICAERSAILSANNQGIRQFKAVAIIARGEDFKTQEPTAPCGLCRQLLMEAAQLGSGDLTCYLSNTEMTKIQVISLSELVPLGFGPKDLGVDLQPYAKNMSVTNSN